MAATDTKFTCRYPDFESTCAIQYTSHELGAWRLGCNAPCASLHTSLPFVYRPLKPRSPTAAVPTFSPLTARHSSQEHGEEKRDSKQQLPWGEQQHAFAVQREELLVGHTLLSATDVKVPAIGLRLAGVGW